MIPHHNQNTQISNIRLILCLLYGSGVISEEKGFRHLVVLVVIDGHKTSPGYWHSGTPASIRLNTRWD